jgi:hypothetical protein
MQFLPRKMLATFGVVFLVVLARGDMLHLGVNDAVVQLKNGFVLAEFDLQKPGIFTLQVNIWRNPFIIFFRPTSTAKVPMDQTSCLVEASS